jgi:hypothetical protein
MNIFSKMMAAVFTVLTFSTATQAQDRIFTYTYQSLVLNQQQREIEVWNTVKTGKEAYSLGLEHRVEFEMGIAKNLQTAFYFNIGSETARKTREVLTLDVNGKPMYMTEDFLEHENEFSFSNEWKLKLSDPSANAIGSALYGELKIGTSECELEGKLLLDKQAGRWTTALNLVGEAEFEPEMEINETEMELEPKAKILLSTAYNVSKGWYIGLEALNDNKFEEGEMEHSALFVGPCFSYATEKFFINFTALPQVRGLKGNSNGNSLNLDAYEKLQARLLFSYAL